MTPLPSHSPDALPLAARRAVLFGAALLHGGALWALLQIAPVRHAVAEVLPIAVDWIATPEPAKAQPVPPRPAAVVQPTPLIAAEPAPTLAEPLFAAAPMASATVAPMPTPAEPVAAAAASSPPMAAPQAPRAVEITAVEYLSPPQLTYPPASRRQHEQGQVQVRVLVDARGLPQQAEVIRTSGHARLDAAALATARSTRFRPYTENGTALRFWVVMPLVFEIEN
jgi:protein TonB